MATIDSTGHTAGHNTGYLTGGTHTHRVAARERTGLWRRHVTDNHGSLDFSFVDPDTFSGGTKVQRCGDLQLVEFWSEPVRYDRRSTAADRDSDDSLRLLLPLSGDLVVSGPSADKRLRPGLAAAVSMAAGFGLEQPKPARALVLTLPSRLWDGPPPRDPVVWELGHGRGAVFGATLREVAAQRAHLDAGSFVQACECAAMLLTGLAGCDAGLVAQARAVARQHADDIEFTPAALAQRLGWSLRSIQLALRQAGTTPAELIRTQRLERAADRLRHPDWRARTISHVAHASGFGSLSAFNAAFRAHFGCTPADLRARSTRQARPSEPA
jgi:AraC-like DNA-binding protein